MDGLSEKDPQQSSRAPAAPAAVYCSRDVDDVTGHQRQSSSSSSSSSNNDGVDVTAHHTHHSHHIRYPKYLSRSHSAHDLPINKTENKVPWQSTAAAVVGVILVNIYVFPVYQVLTKHEYTRSRNGFVSQFCYQSNSQGTQTSSQRISRPDPPPLRVQHTPYQV